MTSSAFESLVKGRKSIGSIPPDSVEDRKGIATDQSLEESKALHSADCKAYEELAHLSFAKRQMTQDQERMLSALCGTGRNYSPDKNSSDLKLREVLGHALIDEFESIGKKVCDSSTRQAWFVTVVSDEHFIDQWNGPAQVWKLRDQIQVMFRQYVGNNVNALFAFELTPIFNAPESNGNVVYSLHAHGLAWGPADFDLPGALKKVRKFTSSITKAALHLKVMNREEHDFRRIARYMLKPPLEGKSVNQDRLEEEFSCLRSVTTGIKDVHHFRLGEYFAKLPIAQLVFAVRGGSYRRERILQRVDKFQETRKGECIELPCKIRQLYKDLYEANKKLSNYTPMEVNFVEPRKAGKSKRPVSL